MDNESIGDSGLGLLHDNAANNVAAAENEIQINLMKGRVEHLEQTREKLIKALENVLSKV
jgi:hypothetical protein